MLSDEALIEKNTVEIVKQMQRLKGIDGDYGSDSAAGNRLAQRRIQNLGEEYAEEESHWNTGRGFQEKVLCSVRRR